MKIQWEVVKKRGNYRPVLKYEIELEQFEIDLAVPVVVLDEALSKPPSSWRSYCYPGEDERGNVPHEWYRLMTPSHKLRKVSGSILLTWRGSDTDFSDVSNAFQQLRQDFEMVLKKAYDYAPISLVETLELTDVTRKHIACGVASAKILSAVGF